MNRTRGWRAWSVGLAAAVTLTVVAGCTSGGDEPPAPSTSDAQPAPTSGTEQPAPPPPTVTPAPTLDPVQPDELSVAPRTSDSTAAGHLAAVEATTDEAGDRLTFSFEDGAVPGYDIRYVDRLTRMQSEDDVIALDGSAVLAVTFTNSTPGTAGVIPDEVSTNEDYDLPVVRQVVLATNLGGTLVFGVGTSSQVPFTVTDDGTSVTVTFARP